MFRWDKPLLLAGAVILVVLVFYLLTLQSSFQAGVRDVVSYNETVNLPWWVGRTMIRMTVAYLLTLAFGLSYGIYAGLHERASHVMLPVLDILQSIPVLGFLVPVFTFMLALFPGIFGQELSSIFLIFTGMAWAVAFNVYGAVRSIPTSLVEASKSFNISGRIYTREVIFPAIFPALISGSILAWGGGWYFLIYSEYFSLGSSSVKLPGLGRYLFAATSSNPPHLGVAVFGLIIMAGIVALINQLVWHPLLDYSTRFSQESGYATHYRRRKAIVRSKVSQTVYREFIAATRPISAATSAFPLSKIFHTHPLPLRVPLSSGRISLPHIRTRIRIVIYLVSIVVFSLIIILLLSPATGQSPLSFLTNLTLEPEAYTIPFNAAASLLRLSAGYVIALSWTLIAGIAVARNRRLASVLLPLFDIGQSVPALALFPFVVIVVIGAFGVVTGGELASVILILTGMQWYILFNIISAVRSIPPEIIESARAFGFHGTRFFRHVLLPAIFPGIVIGSIQAWGGGWNATIVSEYIQLGSTTAITPGLGALLQIANNHTPKPDTLMILLTLVTMSGLVILLNRTVWRFLFKKAQKYRFDS